MKEFINSLTGTRMLVADDREAEYKAAGHRLVAPAEQAKGHDDPPAAPPEKTPDAEPAAAKSTAVSKRKASAGK